MAYLKAKFFRDSFAIFDMMLVVFTSIHLYVLTPMDISSHANPTVFRMLRITRFVRVLRLVRVMRLFAQLRVLVNTCVACISALIWSMVFLMVIMFASSLFLSQLLRDFILHDSGNRDVRLWVFHHYGSGLRSLYTLFEITLAGCWPTYFRPLIEKVSGWYRLFALIYIVLVVFALLRIISALFLKETLQVASADSNTMIMEFQKKQQEYIKKLAKVFEAIDTSKDGRLNIEEFQHVVTHPTVKAWLQALEMAVSDTEMLFNLLDDGDGYITYDEFIQGVVRLRGQAREIDVVAILKSEDRLHDSMGKLAAELHQLIAAMQK